jgi:large subunit ribosomal protein L5e
MGARKKKGKKTKNRAYYMRFNPKMRRRRQAKTDYQARSTLIYQDKDKYNAPKYRFVVRISNRTVTCQVVSSKIVGDEVLASAYSTELPRFGIKVGLTNYAACYATGLLLARRVLQKLGLDEMYKGVEEVTGEHFMQEMEDDEKSPFACVLDVGLRPTTTGARVYAAMKGGIDGGLAIPHTHSGKPFPGWHESEGQAEFNPDELRKYIVGGHVAEYMQRLQESEPEQYEKQFSQYIKAGVEADDLEDIYIKAHEAIREDPKALPKKVADKAQVSKYKRTAKLTLAEKRDHVLNKILSIQKKANV